MKIRIVADSSANLQTTEDHSIVSVPLKIRTDNKEYIDDETLDTKVMAEELAEYRGRSGSSCPGVGEWLDAFGDADWVFGITITSNLSGSYNSAMVAKETYEAEHPNRRVFVMDSLSAGPEITMTVWRLEEMLASGMEYEEVCREITEYQKQTGLVFMLRSLKNFANNGRVSPIIAKLVGLAGICIVGRASDVGTLEPAHKCRGEARSLDALVADMETRGWKKGRVSIGYCNNESAAQRLKEMLCQKSKDAVVEIHPLRGLCSFYAENGGLLVGFEKM